MRLAFMGSPAFAVPALLALREAGHDIAAVYCQPPRPAGRGQAVRQCAVQQAAEQLAVPIRTPARLRHDPAEHAAFAALDLDVAVVAAYGLILPPAMLESPRRGCLNVHASLLPRWRGAAPIQAAILAGDTETGITIMRLDKGLDTGPMLLRDRIAIGPDTTSPSLHDALAIMGARLIVQALGTDRVPVPQPEAGMTHAPKLTRADGRIDWSRHAAALDRQIRALTPWPGSFTTFDGEVLKIVAAVPEQGQGMPGSILDAEFLVGCGEGALRLTLVQRPGRPAVAGDAFLRGATDWRLMQVQ